MSLHKERLENEKHHQICGPALRCRAHLRGGHRQRRDDAVQRHVGLDVDVGQLGDGSMTNRRSIARSSDALADGRLREVL